MTKLNFRKVERNLRGKTDRLHTVFLLAVSALIGSAVAWAAMAKVDIVTRGSGRIVSSIQNQLVQASEGGVIVQRLIDENSRVSPGDLLFVIDPVEAKGELDVAEQRYRSLSIKELRLRSEIDQQSFLVPAVLKNLSPEIAAAEVSLFEARKAQMATSLSVLELKLAQRRQELVSVDASLLAMQRTLELVKEEIRILAPLVQEKVVPATEMLALQRENERITGEIHRLESVKLQTAASIGELEQQVAQYLSEFEVQAVDALTSTMAEMAELRKMLPVLEERVTRSSIRAPIAGIVSRINFRTPGGVVKTGDVVVEIVPTDEDLIVEARIAPKDISNIRLGDMVMIRLSAYDSAKYGTIDGTVVRISADAIIDEQSGSEGVYLVDVSIDGSIVLDGAEEPVEILPGMTAIVDVVSGERSVLEYIWQPVAKVQELALRD